MNTTTTTARARPARPGLRTSLLLDAVVTGTNGLAYVAGAGLLTSWLGPSPTVLAPVGLFLVVYGIGVAVVGSRRPPSRRGAIVVVDANLLWVVTSVAVLLGGWLDLTTLGAVWLLVQTGVVAGFATLQVLALRAGR